MDNVVDLFKKDLKHCSYYERGSDIGVSMLGKSLIILPLNFKEVEVYVSSPSIVFKREELAEFLHVATCFIDSKNKWLPDLDLVGFNYK